MAEQEFVIRQTSVEFQNDLDKVERLLEVRSLGVGLRLDAVAKQLSALVTTEENSEAPFEISDDGGYTIFRIDDEGEILTKAFDSHEINQILRIYQLGTGLVLNGNTLSVDSSISGLAKIYSIGQGLTLNNQGELFVNNDLYNLAKIYSIGDGLVLDAQGALSANVSDVTVDGVSIVTSKVARILSQVKTQDTPDGAFELVDDTGNVALQITSEGHLRTKEFDSSNINILPETVNDRYLHTNATTGELEWSEVQGGEGQDFKVVPTLPVPEADSPKVVYNLLDCGLYVLDMNTGTSNLVGVGLVGYMLVG